MSTKSVLEYLKPRLAWALKQAAEAEKAEQDAQQAYDIAWANYVSEARQRFEAEREDVIHARFEAEKTAERAREEANKLDAEARTHLRDYFTAEHIPSLEPVKSFKINRVKELVYDPDILLRAAMTYAPFLLKLDEKAVEKFVLDNCYEDDPNRFVLPQRMAMFLPIGIRVKPQPVIMGKDLIKNAPAEKPEDPVPYIAPGEDEEAYLNKSTFEKLKGSAAGDSFLSPNLAKQMQELPSVNEENGSLNRQPEIATDIPF